MNPTNGKCHREPQARARDGFEFAFDFDVAFEFGNQEELHLKEPRRMVYPQRSTALSALVSQETSSNNHALNQESHSDHQTCQPAIDALNDPPQTIAP